MIHAFKLQDNCIVLDVASGSIHLVDDITLDIFSRFDSYFTKDELLSSFVKRYPKETLLEIYDEITELYEEGSLYSKDDPAQIYYKKDHTKIGLKALCLNVAHDCNMICDYCFATTGDYRGKRMLMSSKTAKKALLFLVENSGSRKNVEVDFFGGEPLLNFKVIKEAVLYGKSIEKIFGKKINYTITTNGTLLNDEIKDFINNEMDNIVISIDGREKVHDKIRKTKALEGTHQKIIKNAKNILNGRDKNKTHYIRGTFTRYNLDFSNDVMYLYDQGFDVISIEPVIGSGSEYHITMDDVDKIKAEYEALVCSIKEKKRKGHILEFYHFNAKIYDGPCIYKRIAACGAGFEYLAVSPDGILYPCHQFVGESGFEMGNVDEGIKRNDIKECFVKCNVIEKEDCVTCWAKYFCSGGCHANSYYSCNDIKKPDKIFCELQKKRIECAIYLQIEETG